MPKGVAFLLCASDELLEFLGIPYGMIVLEGGNGHEVLHLAEAESILDELLEKGIITNDDSQAPTVKRAATASLCMDMATVVQKVVQKQIVPRNSNKRRVKSRLQFDLCTACEDKLPHGSLISYYGEPQRRLAWGISNVAQILNDCRRYVQTKDITLYQATSLVQQVIRAGLPLDWDDLLERIGWPDITKELAASVRYHLKNIDYHNGQSRIDVINFIPRRFMWLLKPPEAMANTMTRPTAPTISVPAPDEAIEAQDGQTQAEEPKAPNLCLVHHWIKRD